MNLIRRFLTIATLLGVVCFAANASVIGYSAQYGAGGAPVTTNWATTLNLTQFDTLGGTRTLDQVLVTFTGNILGDAKFESLDAAPATVTLNLSTAMTASYPVGVMLSLAPAVTQVANASAFDGVIDFGGTSGNTYTGLNGTASTSATYTSGVELATFTGTGTVPFALVATGTSGGTGSGNLITQFATQAAGTITVEYTYHEQTAPEPATMAMLGSALIGLGLIGRKRFAR